MKKKIQSTLLSKGAGVRIAVLDSGVNPSYPGFKGKVKNSFICMDEEDMLSIIPTQTNTDASGHGTVVQHCVLNVAPEATVDHYKILNSKNQCSAGKLCRVLEQIVSKKYHIINLSLGTRSEDYIPWLVGIMKRAYEANVAMVTAWSNVGNIIYPARFTYCISVEAFFGKMPTELVYRPGKVVEFAGHGVNISVPTNSGGSQSVTGSSFAAAHTTGIAARILENNPGLTPLELKLSLIEYARFMKEKRGEDGETLIS